MCIYLDGDLRPLKRPVTLNTRIIIPYNKLEGILGDHLIKYKGFVWTSKEDIKLFPDILHLSNPMPTGDYETLMIRYIQSIEGARQ